MSFHVCVWLDHTGAKIFQLGVRGDDLAEIDDSRPPHHIHQSSDHLGLGKVPMDPVMLAAIDRHLQDAGAILLAGPGEAKFELRNYLQQHSPAVAGRIWGVEPGDHPTNHQIVAWARKWFKAQDRLH